MEHTRNHARPRAYWLLLAAPALLSTPALAQEVAAPPPVAPTQAQTPPPPVVPTVRAAPAAQTPPPSRETGNPVSTDTTSSASKTRISPEAQAALDEPTPRAARSAPRAAAPARPAARAVAQTPTPAPAAAAPAAAPAPAPAAAPAASAPTTAAPADNAATTATESTPATDAVDTSNAKATTTTEQNQPSPIWPWLLGGALVVAAVIGFLLFRRRRDALVDQYEPDEGYVYREPEPVAAPVPVAAVEPAYAEPAYVEPVVAAESVTPVPSTPEEITVSEAEADEVAALTSDAPVDNRPWLEFAMRPVRAGTNVDEAMVEIELTVANAGSVAARDVRVSTFMLTEAHADEMERYLVEPPVDAAVEPVTIEPGEGARIDATLAALKADLGVTEGFKPVVVADARYTLPDGSEGRTSASFVIGRPDGGGTLLPFDLDERQMHDDVEVRLHGTPEHA